MIQCATTTQDSATRHFRTHKHNNGIHIMLNTGDNNLGLNKFVVDIQYNLKTNKNKECVYN